MVIPERDSIADPLLIHSVRMPMSVALYLTVLTLTLAIDEYKILHLAWHRLHDNPHSPGCTFWGAYKDLCKSKKLWNYGRDLE